MALSQPLILSFLLWFKTFFPPQTTTDFDIRFPQFSTINYNAEKWEKNQTSSKVLHYAFQLAFYLCLEERLNTAPRQTLCRELIDKVSYFTEKHLHLMFRKVTRRPIKPTSTSSCIDLVIHWIFIF